MDAQRLTYLNSDGAELSARLDPPADGEPVVFAVFAHCFTCSKDLSALGDISRAP